MFTNFFFFQATSVKVVDEIKFKTIIPASSLVIRDHCWLTDGMSVFFLVLDNAVK